MVVMVALVSCTGIFGVDKEQTCAEDKAIFKSVSRMKQGEYPT